MPEEGLGEIFNHIPHHKLSGESFSDYREVARQLNPGEIALITFSLFTGAIGIEGPQKTLSILDQETLDYANDYYREHGAGPILVVGCIREWVQDHLEEEE